MLTPIQTRYNKLGPKLAERLKKRFFEAWYFEDTGDALGKLYELVPADHSVSWGGSMTLDTINAIDTSGGESVQAALGKKGCRLIDRDKAPTPEERAELQRQALLADTFLGSVNAISESGEIVNIDGMGNRVAAYIYGPKQVVLLVGMNKVAKSLEDAMVRARTVAAPLNTQRFGDRDTPCSKTGACGNCISPDSICSYITIMRLCKPAGRIKVILVGKDLGL
ncbi:MAG: lactate utilization protein [Spirochaetaceae bacterium]|nr:lactate utilization protein [Spirochaetaceae bacterium]